MTHFGEGGIAEEGVPFSDGVTETSASISTVFFSEESQPQCHEQLSYREVNATEPREAFCQQLGEGGWARVGGD